LQAITKHKREAMPGIAQDHETEYVASAMMQEGNEASAADDPEDMFTSCLHLE
jgi:hypothetical protein